MWRLLVSACLLGSVVAGGGKYDVIIYGATPSGIAAALSAARVSPGRSIALLEIMGAVGGMASQGGIGLRDHNQNLVPMCCTMNDWAMMNARYYNKDAKTPVFIPDHYVGQMNFEILLNQHNISTFVNEEVEPGSVQLDPSTRRITSFKTASGVWRASIFIDASYEGLIMREVATNTWGRESIAQYKESFAGARTPGKPSFPTPVSGYVSDSNKTLLPWVYEGQTPSFGEADKGVMGWSYRLCITNNTEIKVPFPKPANYNEQDFELMRRYIATLQEPPTLRKLFTIITYEHKGNYPIPNRKWDLCDGFVSPVTSDVIDATINAYINGTSADRKKVHDDVQYYVMGFLYFLTSSPEVPEATRASVAEYGLCGDEWPENQHIPPQLYVREALRMVGDGVFTQNDWNRSTVEDSIGLGSWGIDIHVVHRRVDAQGHVYDEGYFDPGTGQHVFELPLRLIMPKRSEVQNLMSTSTPSATHVTWACIREEPTLWRIGMAAGTVAGMIGLTSAVQDVPLAALQKSLVSQGSNVHNPSL